MKDGLKALIVFGAGFVACLVAQVSQLTDGDWLMYAVVAVVGGLGGMAGLIAVGVIEGR